MVRIADSQRDAEQHVGAGKTNRVQPGGAQRSVREAVESFYAAFYAHQFDRAADVTTADWWHINPFGGATRGQDAVLSELREVPATFLKGATDQPESIDVRFAQPDTAVVTETSRAAPTSRRTAACMKTRRTFARL